MVANRCGDLLASPREVAVESSSRIDLPYIPDDLIFNILLRLPPKPVVRFRCVCKAWLTMLSSQRFIGAHLEFSKARPTMLIVGTEYHIQELERKTAFSMGFYKYNGGDLSELLHGEHFPGGIGQLLPPLHCDGLILNYTRDQELMVCNPGTRDFVSLPKGSDTDICHGVGFGRDPCSNKYKVARFFHQWKDGTTKVCCRFEVLTLGTNVWRRTVNPPYPILGGMAPAHVRGFIYWRILFYHIKMLVRFSLADETFSLTPYPPCQAAPIRLLELEGELCCACFAKPCEVVEIWTCSNTDMPTWTQRCTIQLPQETVILGSGSSFKLPTFTFHGKDLLIRGGHKLYQYSIETGEMKKIALAVEGLRDYHPENEDEAYLGKELAFQIVNYAESLVPIRGYKNSVKQSVFQLVARIFVRTLNLITYV